MIHVSISDASDLTLEDVVFDVNGTLAYRGNLMPGVAERIAALKKLVRVRLASADTFDSLDKIAATLELEAIVAPTAAAKLRLLEALGPASSAHVGNGTNDAAALERAALGIAVLGPEGVSRRAIAAADIFYISVINAIDALLDPRILAASLKGGDAE